MMTSAAETPSSSWIPTGTPRPLSRTETLSSACIVTDTKSACLAKASSIPLSTTS